MPKKRSLYALLLVILSSAFFIALQLFNNFRNADRRFESFTDSLFRQEVSSNSITLHYTLSHPESYNIHEDPICKCQYKNAQKVENKNVRFPGAIPQLVIP